MVIGNASGNAHDALRSTFISEQLLRTKDFLPIKLPGCGKLAFSNKDAQAIVGKNMGSMGKEAFHGLKFQPLGDMEQESLS